MGDNATMKPEHFRITYDGPALETSEMDVDELAPALLAIGDLLNAATYTLSADRLKAQVNVRGSFKSGCFGIDFTLGTDWIFKIRDMLAGTDATAAANALAILGALGWAGKQARPGLFAVLKWLRGRKISRVEQRDGVAVLHVDDEQLEIELAVLALLRDVAVRQSCGKVLVPLLRNGVTTFAVGDDTGEFYAVVNRDEVTWFSAPEPEDELLVDDERRMVFSIVSLAFKEDNKWRLHDGASTIHAKIDDEEFLARVDANQETFSKGDVLICDVRVQQWQTPTGAKTEYTVLRVREHRSASRQISLPGL